MFNELPWSFCLIFIPNISSTCFRFQSHHIGVLLNPSDFSASALIFCYFCLVLQWHMKLQPISVPHARHNVVQWGENCSLVLTLESERKKKKCTKNPNKTQQTSSRRTLMPGVPWQPNLKIGKRLHSPEVADWIQLTGIRFWRGPAGINRGKLWAGCSWFWYPNFFANPIVFSFPTIKFLPWLSIGVSVLIL